MLSEVPEDPESWTYGKIVDLINEGYDENEILEFKKEINLESKRLCQTVCAFANTKCGTIIFGIDNDRTNPLHLHDRIIGLDDSDQLKRNIIDKIKNIKPNVPIENTIFRKTNIRLPNKKVLPIMKILPSKLAPHQYENIFYKRVTGGNEPMNVDEIKNMILDTQKNARLLILLRQVLGFLKDFCIKMQEKLSKDDLLGAFGTAEIPSIEFARHFLLNQSFVYPYETQNSLLRIVEHFSTIQKFTKKYYHETDYGSKNMPVQTRQAAKAIFKGRVDEIIEKLSELEQSMKIELIPPVSRNDIKKSKEDEQSNKS